MNLCKRQTDIAEEVFEMVDWHHPDMYLDEQYQSGELVICRFCGNLFRSYDVDRCPYCGTERNEGICQKVSLNIGDNLSIMESGIRNHDLPVSNKRRGSDGDKDYEKG